MHSGKLNQKFYFYGGLKERQKLIQTATILDSKIWSKSVDLHLSSDASDSFDSLEFIQFFRSSKLEHTVLVETALTVNDFPVK